MFRNIRECMSRVSIAGLAILQTAYCLWFPVIVYIEQQEFPFAYLQSLGFVTPIWSGVKADLKVIPCNSHF